MNHRINYMQMFTDGTLTWRCSCNKGYQTLDQLIDHIRKEIAYEDKRLTTDILTLQHELQ